MAIHVWHEDGRFFWDDAEDHGGFDRNVPCGPFPSRESAIEDAQQLFPANVHVFDFKPPRYD
jgi:hypothetical protein